MQGSCPRTRTAWIQGEGGPKSLKVGDKDSMERPEAMSEADTEVQTICGGREMAAGGGWQNREAFEAGSLQGVSRAQSRLGAAAGGGLFAGRCPPAEHTCSRQKRACFFRPVAVLTGCSVNQNGSFRKMSKSGEIHRHTPAALRFAGVLTAFPVDKPVDNVENHPVGNP